ncbi:MAG: 6,7-dimethyl-8-ribityllumazine synthase, partial [Bacteroidaceae bacterium]|nr:6,7-dimethyl-8-ribityllumazine synthase [Bacteroidaceae bacterium]
MATAFHNLSEYETASLAGIQRKRFGIVVSEWNPHITGALLEGAIDTLKKEGALDENIFVKQVPGSFELIYGATQMIQKYDCDAVIVLGCVVRGDTPHFDYVCQGVTQGIAQLNAIGKVP